MSADRGTPALLDDAKQIVSDINWTMPDPEDVARYIADRLEAIVKREVAAALRTARADALREAAAVAADHAKTWGHAHGTPATVIESAILALIDRPAEG